MDNGGGVLERFLAACGNPAWAITREDVDRVVAGLAEQGLAASTRRGYVQAFKGFHAFLVARKATEIESRFGVRLVDPVDEFNSARHVGADSPGSKPPPGPERLEEFFDFCRQRIATARKYGAARRDYALFRTLYLAGRRKPPRWTGPMSTSAVARSARSMSGSARAPRPQDRGRGECRCWTVWI